MTCHHQVTYKQGRDGLWTAELYGVSGRGFTRTEALTDLMVRGIARDIEIAQQRLPYHKPMLKRRGQIVVHPSGDLAPMLHP